MPRQTCRFYPQGKCRYGASCRFSHTETTITIEPTKSSRRKGDKKSIPNKRREKDVFRLVKALNAFRSAGAQGHPPIPVDHKLFTVLSRTLRMEMHDIDIATESIQDALDLHDSEEEDDELSEDYAFTVRPRETYASRSSSSVPKYFPPTFSPAQTVRYTTLDRTWNHETNTYTSPPLDWSRLDAPEIKNVVFGPNFGILDSHIQEFTKRPALCQRLERFRAGDSDTGHGGAVYDEAAFIDFVRLCPSIRVFYLEAFKNLSDATLMAMIESCPKLEAIHLSGNDKVKGRVKGPALEALTANPELAPSLKDLTLYDQPFELRDKIMNLSQARKTLWIHDGDTLGNGMAVNMLAAMTGGEETRSWLGGTIVQSEVDQGMYGPGGYDVPDSFFN